MDPRSTPRGRGRGGTRGIGRNRGSLETRGRGSSRGHSRGGAMFRASQPDVTNGDQEYNAHLAERFRRGRGRVDAGRRAQDKLTQAADSGFDMSLNIKIRQYVEGQDAVLNESGQESWLMAPEVATRDEISLLTGEPVNLPANRIHKPYKSVAKYLKTQYTLLREDAVGNLRDAIDKFRRDPDMVDDKEVSIYEKVASHIHHAVTTLTQAQVHIAGFTFAANGIAARIKFSTARAGKRIQWQASKRLVSGSIVALSSPEDSFKSICKIAIVAARPLELLDRSPPEIDIYFSRPEDIEIDPQKRFVMVEAKSGYYEANRHTLKALQKMSAETFPMSQNVIAKSLEIEPPQYLVASPVLDMSSACSSQTSSDLSNVNILEAWPSLPAGTSLDSTQWEALRQILTKNFAIIQGPPGTGKTHVSTVALRIMAENRADGDPPIIIAAQTNHALDQLLAHVSQFEPDYIRLGGRSTNAEVKKRALFEVTRKERIPQVPGSSLSSARIQMNSLCDSFAHILALLDDSPEPISVETFFLLGIITKKQKESLENAVKNWVTAGSAGLSAMQHWLHKSLIPFQVTYAEDNFGFEELEEDLEVEQIRETEAEHGISDEEDIEMLRGQWKAVADNWTVSEPTDMDLQRAKQLLDTKQDLWAGVPEHLRGPVYLVMQQRAKDMALARFREAAVSYGMISKETRIGKWEKDSVYLKRAKIIGMTTTGLSKYRPLIASLEPKIILIEEAAEVIEAPIAAACIESLQHLILVGDHKQLQGHCSVRDLEGPDYNLNVSMFERLVNMGMPFKMLLKQRRMDPTFRSLISSLYPELEDHADVLCRPDPPEWGTGKMRSFFLHHKWFESKDDSMSTYNEEEARLVAKFYRHLRHNNVPPTGVTILTFYNGQRKRILKELRKDAVTNASYNNVKTVDSYQGEESAIIILSLARSNEEGKIGFLEIENRVCVALSRARSGFFIFGNADLVSERSPLWRNVVDQMAFSNPQRIGEYFPIQCVNHGKTMLLQYPDEWDGLEGGCDMMCNGRLACGHSCVLKCHGYAHDTVLCQRSCERVLACNHTCQKICYEQCRCDCPDFERATAAVVRAALARQHEPLSASSNGKTSTTSPQYETGLKRDPKNWTRVQPRSLQTSDAAATRFVPGPNVQLARGGGSFEIEPHDYSRIVRAATYGVSEGDSQSVVGEPSNLSSHAEHHTAINSNISDRSPEGLTSGPIQAQHETLPDWSSFTRAGFEQDGNHRILDDARAHGRSVGSQSKEKADLTDVQKDLLDHFGPQQYRAMNAAAISTAIQPDEDEVKHGETERNVSARRSRYVQEYIPNAPHRTGFGFPAPRAGQVKGMEQIEGEDDGPENVRKVMERVNLLD